MCAARRMRSSTIRRRSSRSWPDGFQVTMWGSDDQGFRPVGRSGWTDRVVPGQGSAVALSGDSQGREADRVKRPDRTTMSRREAAAMARPSSLRGKSDDAAAAGPSSTIAASSVTSRFGHSRPLPASCRSLFKERQWALRLASHAALAHPDERYDPAHERPMCGSQQ